MLVFLANIAIFSSISLNLLLQFGLGTTGAAGDTGYKTEAKREIPFTQFFILFVSVLFLWMFFNYLAPASLRSFPEYFLFFPFSSLMCMGLEFLGERVFPKLLPGFFSHFKGIRKTFNAFTAYEGLVPASLMIAFAIAGSFAGAFILALFFAIGNILATVILNEIRRRATLESVPRYLRGSPLILVSMGLLSLVSASAAGVFFKILEVF